MSDLNVFTHLHQSLDNCDWKSVLFFSREILSSDPQNLEALVSKSLALYCSEKYNELEEWMKTIPLSIMSKNKQLVEIRCRALLNQQMYSYIIPILGGDLSTPLVPIIMSIDDVLESPTLSAIRQNAISNISQTETFPIEIVGNKNSELTDPLSEKTMTENIKNALMFHDPHLIEQYTKICDRTSQKDDLLLTACGCYKYLNDEKIQGKAYVMKATEENPDCEIAWLSLLFMFTETLEWEQGFITINKVSRRFPNSDSVSLFAISLYLKSGSVQLAWPWIKKSTINDPFYQHEKAVATFMDGQIAEASHLFKEIIDNIENINENEFQNEKRFENIKSEIKDANHENDKLRYKCCQKEISKDLVGSSYINFAHCLRRLGEFPDAIEWYTHAIPFHQIEAETLASIGFTYQLMGKIDDAISWFNSCLSVDSVHPFATKMLSVIYMNQS
ncbi:TPR Domain containing protein [Tritrichomonas foetus]|uniref:TPR Domain containing protein n=1 Tax=Tritrichomonas foetus TaxID=1144522 RepID=A0A1J4JP41_9EUKA|nr:TPR Domain containing protein [Tritrichomonas foetus]|eukprot:OHT00811.1 TPR Domain containing protein [Tritrichomonas foetus]